MTQLPSVAESIPLYQLLWAKTDREDKTRTHPLICHLIDVAQVARAMWESVLTEGLRKHFAQALGLDGPSAGRVIAFWAGLHDLGKATPEFQRMYAPAVARLSEAGLSFPTRFAHELRYHGTMSGLLLEPLLQTETDLAPRLARSVSRAVGGHHGAWPTPNELQSLSDAHLGADDWDTVRRQLFAALAQVFEPPAVERLGVDREEEHAALTLFSGLTSAADWIGSMEHYFSLRELPVEPSDYAADAARLARRALDELGWTGSRPPREPVSFHDLFRFEPRPMQQAVVGLAEKLTPPALVIIEAPTGTGKTEAALYLADRWAVTGRQRGLYVAMPTMATSNQMFDRVRSVLADRYPDSLVNLHLIHSQSRWLDDVRQLRLDTTDERKGGTVASMAWFLPRKRSLLAPFGVGTVDQALLSVLQTRHFFVRLFGLSHKTVVFDEVHAYDTYMSTLFQRLLRWLRAVGTSVVILSATLPERTRRELLQAYAGVSDAPPAPYPSITWAMEEQVGAELIEAPETRVLSLQWIGREPNAVVSVLQDALLEGGCAAVICNTVARAQGLYQALREAGIVPEEHLTLFHARFPFGWRHAIERQVLARFGKEGERPYKAVVVATQVIEQSLDLDFDLMVSDLAPADLILQRAGRLHRHEREHRPRNLTSPRLLLTSPEMRGELPVWGSDEFIYEPYVLLRSYLVLRDVQEITLPDQTAPLIEAVYGDDSPAVGLSRELSEGLADALEKMMRRQEQDSYIARTKLVPTPSAEGLMRKSNLALTEDQPEVHQALQALTRLGPPSISLVCLHRVGDGLNTEPDGSGLVVDLVEEPNAETTTRLVASTVSISHRQLVQHLQAQQPPVGWQEHPLLRRYRPAVFVDGVCDLQGQPWILRLDRQLGLIVERREE